MWDDLRFNHQEKKVYKRTLLFFISTVIVCIGIILIPFYLLSTPTQITFCEEYPVYYYSPFGDCDRVSPTYTRTRVLGPNIKVEELNVTCRGDILVLDKEYVDKECTPNERYWFQESTQ